MLNLTAKEHNSAEHPKILQTEKLIFSMQKNVDASDEGTVG